MSQRISNRRQPSLNAPFRVKSAGVSLVIILIVGLYYLANVLPMLSSAATVPDGALSLVVTTVALVIGIEVVLQIVLFIGAGQVEDRTAGDEIVTARASRNAYSVLTVGVFATFGSLFFGYSPFQMGSILLLAFVLAEVVKFGSQIVYYRRSA